MKLCADISEIRKDTGWKPSTTFEAGIEKILNYQRKGNLD